MSLLNQLIVKTIEAHFALDAKDENAKTDALVKKENSRIAT